MGKPRIGRRPPPGKRVWASLREESHTVIAEMFDPAPGVRARERRIRHACCRAL
jgi:hypothetical protein